MPRCEERPAQRARWLTGWSRPSRNSPLAGVRTMTLRSLASGVRARQGPMLECFFGVFANVLVHLRNRKTEHDERDSIAAALVALVHSSTYRIAASFNPRRWLVAPPRS